VLLGLQKSKWLVLLRVPPTTALLSAIVDVRLNSMPYSALFVRLPSRKQ
jgi:hypothetical protein